MVFSAPFLNSLESLDANGTATTYIIIEDRFKKINLRLENNHLCKIKLLIEKLGQDFLISCPLPQL